MQDEHRKCKNKLEKHNNNKCQKKNIKKCKQ